MNPVSFFGWGRLGLVGVGVCLGLALMAPVCSGNTGFTGSLDRAQLVALKLDHLTSAELAALDAAIEAYLTGVQAVSRHEEIVHKFGKDSDSAATEVDLKSRIAGPFNGWSGGTLFCLENGQLWQQVGSEVYYHPFPNGVDVTVYHGSLGSYRLGLPNGFNVQVRRR